MRRAYCAFVQKRSITEPRSVSCRRVKKWATGMQAEDGKREATIAPPSHFDELRGKLKWITIKWDQACLITGVIRTPVKS